MSCPSPAERARTLVQGRLPGLLFLEGAAAPLPVRHGTGRSGQPLLLVPVGGRLYLSLRTHRGPVAPGAVLRVDDVTPSAGAPSLGRVRVSGRLHAVPPSEAAAAALEFAEANPLPSLLGVGTDAVLYRLLVDGVGLETETGGGPVDTVAYLTAEPDPLHEAERDLLLDLADHHGEQLEPWFRRALHGAGIHADHPRAVRLDRYGIVVDTGRPLPGRRRWVRLEFTHPLDTVEDLAQLLHPVLFHQVSEFATPCCDHRHAPEP
ncbi:DUF2470 domain-containing protein [Jiangella mangrovi]|uniref:DUF2470 domain-containing protein n=1 Tax=Jiangella mangrovi TaxID=1524084 RepID=A0A7W9LM75_9ACTN|nr:DUF2470 domain-containing protein [Jiangella mangrovi]MBB5788879.1 hypothetical protein [Jiangella mangrovi]